MPPSTMSLSKRHAQILCAIFEQPTRADIRWADFLALCRALGAELPKSGKIAGSRQRIALRGRKAVFHKPHPEPTMKKGSVESATPAREGCPC